MLKCLSRMNLSISENVDVTSYQPLFEAYIVLNAIALSASLCCKGISAVFTYSALK